MIQLEYYHAEWCGPCKMLDPVLSQIEQEYPGRVMISRIDVDQNKQQTLTANIRSVPTIFIYRDGQLISTQIGAAPKSVLVSKMGL